MGNATVIEFPKSQSLKKRLQDKAQDQKSVLVLSLASVFLVAIFMNQALTVRDSQDLQAQGVRGIASYQPTQQDVKWEHDLAKKLSDDIRAKALALAEKPTLRDELVFGYLEGKYGMKILEGRIQALEFIDAQAGDQPLQIENRPSFLTSYSAAFGLDYSQVSLKQTSAQEEIFNLIAADKTILGEARFVLDDQGRVLSVKITR